MLQAADSHRFGGCIGKNVTQPKYSLHVVASGYRSCRRSYRLTTVISDSTPCAGQPLLVAATATDPTNGSLPVAIAIDGSPGSPQLVQLMAPAPARQIEIFARTRSGATERRVLNVADADCPQTKQTREVLTLIGKAQSVPVTRHYEMAQ